MESLWPDGTRCAVVLSFDLDAETLWLSRNPASADSPVVLSQGAYGPRVGVPRLLRMMERAGVRGTFFVPGWVVEKHREVVREIVATGHEVGYHGYLHERVRDPQEEMETISRCRGLMGDLLGVAPVGYRAPMFEILQGTMERLADAGFEYSSNFMDSDHPYLHRLPAGRALVELPTNWLFDDSAHFFFTMQDPPRRPIATPSAVMEIWRSEFDAIYDEGGCLVFVLHPQVIGRGSRVRLLEQLVAYMRGRPGTWLAPGFEVARAARRALESP